MEKEKTYYMIKFKRLDWNTEINNMPFEKGRFFIDTSTHEKVFFKDKLIGYYIIMAPDEYSVTANKVYSLPRARYFIPLNVDYKYWTNNPNIYGIRLDNYPNRKKKYVKEQILKILDKIAEGKEFVADDKIQTSTRKSTINNSESFKN